MLPSFDAEPSISTVTESDKTTGLARVLVQSDASDVGDNLAVQALNAIRKAALNGTREYRILVSPDPLSLHDFDVYQAVQDTCERLRKRLGSPPQTEKRETLVRDVPETGAETRVEQPLVRIPGAGSLVTMAIQGVTFLSKLFARNYQISGAATDVSDLGFDMQVAHALRRSAKQDESVSVKLSRFERTPAAEVVKAIHQLADAAALQLAPKVAEADADIAQQSARVTAKQASLTALDEQILELIKRVAVDSGGSTPAPELSYATVSSNLTTLRDERAMLSNEIIEGRATMASRQSARAPYAALLQDVGAFLDVVSAPGAGDGDSLLVRAARGESLATPNSGVTHIVNARLLAGGLDQTIETKVGADRWETLAGVSAECAVMDASGALIFTDTISLLRSSRMTLGHPDTFKQDLVSGFPPTRD